LVITYKQASARAIALQIVNKVRQQPKAYSAAGIQKDVQLDGVLIPYKQAWRAKEVARDMIDGSHDDLYSLLPYYCQQIEATNPNSTAIVECYGEISKFRRLFLCYGASACSVVHCRPVIGLDGTHLKAKYRGILSTRSSNQGILLAATAIDAHGALFPVASGVIDAENDENWRWFLEHLHDVFSHHAPNHLEVPEKLIFVSDRQKGFIDSVNKFFPSSPHAYCLRHLQDNMHKRFPNNELDKLLWRAARATTVAHYDEAIKQMRTISVACVNWLEKTADKEHVMNRIT
jgi:MULE transposase domain